MCDLDWIKCECYVGEDCGVVGIVVVKFLCYCDVVGVFGVGYVLE